MQHVFYNILIYLYAKVYKNQLQYENTKLYKAYVPNFES